MPLRMLVFGGPVDFWGLFCFVDLLLWSLFHFWFVAFDDDVLNEDWINHRMVRSHRSAVTATVGAGRHWFLKLDPFLTFYVSSL
jgi:hypothetical protein